MKQYPIKRKCKSCKGMAILMPPQKQEDGSVNPKEAYYYHYSQYSDCRQRMDVKSKLLGQWRNKDEIRNLSELLTTERKRTKNPSTKVIKGLGQNDAVVFAGDINIGKFIALAQTLGFGSDTSNINN